jgi:hypothetical protein
VSGDIVIFLNTTSLEGYKDVLHVPSIEVCVELSTEDPHGTRGGSSGQNISHTRPPAAKNLAAVFSLRWRK